jgi:hypothetical protein
MNRMKKAVSLALLLTLANMASVLLCARAQCQESVGQESVGQESVGQDDVEIIVVIGAEGEPEFGEQFGKWANTWKSFADRTQTKFTAVGRSAIGEKSDRELLKSAIAHVANRPSAAKHSSATWIVLIGHGTYSQRTAKFNLRGPDVSANEMSKWIQPIQSPLVIVNCSSSSSPFINQLSGENRVIVTATKSGTQYNFSRFGKYFADAISSMDSDLDHDEEVSVQEAFVRASSEVNDFYLSQDRIATEHALIDDNGDAKGTPAKMFRGVRPIATAKDGAELDGKVASKMTLPTSDQKLKLTPDERKQRAELENQLEKLRQRKADLDPDEYFAAIEPLLVGLAKIYRDAESRSKASASGRPTPK